MKKALLVVIVLAAVAVVGFVAFRFLSGADGRARAERMVKIRGEFAAKNVQNSKWIAPPSSVRKPWPR